MGITGKHGKNTGDRTAAQSKHVPRHGGPQTGDGRLPQGAKPQLRDVQVPGVCGKAFGLAWRLLNRGQ